MKTITKLLYFLKVNKIPFARSVTANIASLFSRLRWQLHRRQLNCLSFSKDTRLRISYAHRKFPDPLAGKHAFVSGGAIKYVYLNDRFPHAGKAFNVLYAVSSSHYPRLNELITFATASGAKLVWNQNGVYHPQNYPNYEQLNSLLSIPYRRADYVFYQSRFCRESALRFLGPSLAPSSVLYNAVDTNRFSPGTREYGRDRILRLIVGGTHYSSYRLPCAILALSRVLKVRPAHLTIAGNIAGRYGMEARRLIKEHGLEGHIEFTGPYSQAEAPLILRRSDIYLHTKYLDPCPGAVIEAMACGLPVVYSMSGGTPELVGSDAGIGIEAPECWSTDIPPDPKRIAESVLRIGDDLKSYSLAARQRSLEFDIKPWLRKHEEIIESLR